MELFGQNDVQNVWRPDGKAYDPKYVVPTVKHGGGSIMIHGFMSSSGVGVLTLVNGIMESNQYIEILQNGLTQSAGKMGMPRNRWIFQQDNGLFLLGCPLVQFFTVTVFFWT